MNTCGKLKIFADGRTFSIVFNTAIVGGVTKSARELYFARIHGPGEGKTKFGQEKERGGGVGGQRGAVKRLGTVIGKR